MPTRHHHRTLVRSMTAVAIAVVAGVAGAGPATAAAGTAAVDPACFAAVDPPAGSLATVTARAPLGVYLWLDDAAWHLRVSNPDAAAVTFTGEIAACRPMHVATYLLESGDTLATRADDTGVLGFALTDDGTLDGFEFNAACPTTFTFSVAVDGQPIPPDEIHIGARDEHPASSTFALAGCPSSAITPVGLQTQALDAGPEGGDPTLGALPALALLSLPSAELGWQQLVLPLRTRPLSGDPDATTGSGPQHVRRGLVATVLPALLFAVEIALGVGVVAAGLRARRYRRRT